MTTDNYPSSNAPEINQELIMNWWSNNWQWLLPIILIISLIIIAITILTIISQWKFYEKANRPGWAALIPFYSQYVFIDVINRPVWMFWTWLTLFIFSYVVPLPILSTLTGLAIFVFSIIWALDLAKVFGQGTGFGVATIFFPFVTYPILAFSKNIKYIGTIAPNEESKNTNVKNNSKKTFLIVLLVVFLPLLLIGLSILGMYFMSKLMGGTMEAGRDMCKIEYAKSLEKSLDQHYKMFNFYPENIKDLDSTDINEGYYEYCSGDVSYKSDGNNYTIEANIPTSTHNNENINNGIYRLSK